MVMSRAELSLLYAMKRDGPKQGQEGGCDLAVLVSFGGQIDRDAVTRMSGRHRMISLGTSLTDEGPCLVCGGNLSSSWTYGNDINLRCSE